MAYLFNDYVLSYLKQYMVNFSKSYCQGITKGCYVNLYQNKNVFMFWMIKYCYVFDAYLKKKPSLLYQIKSYLCCEVFLEKYFFKILK